MNEVAVGAPEASHKTLPCFDRLTEMGTYFHGGHVVLGWSLYFLEVSLYFPVVSLRVTVPTNRDLKKNFSILDNYFTVGSHFVLTFELRPRYLTGLLFHAQSDKTSLNVFLMENKARPFTHKIKGAI